MASSSSSSSSVALSRRKAIFAKRQFTLMKKAYELSTLCGIDVCVICYGPDGMLQTWPKDIWKVRDMAEKYKRLSETEKRKRRLDLSDFPEKKSRGLEGKLPAWDKRFDGYSAEKLSELEGFLESKLQRLEKRLRSLDLKKQENATQLTVDSNQESNSCKIQPDPHNFRMLLSSVPGDQRERTSVNLLADLRFRALPCNYFAGESSNCCNNSGDLTLAANALFNDSYGCLTYGRSNTDDHVPYHANGASDFLNQASIPLTGWQNHSASDAGVDWTCDCNFLATGMSSQSGNSGNINVGFLMQQGSENGDFQHSNNNNSLLINNNHLSVPFSARSWHQLPFQG